MDRTILKLTPSSSKINHHDNILLMGSCFSDTMGEKLAYYGFKTMINPFGTTYNPVSIAKLLSLALNTQTIDDQLFVENQEVNYHHDFHSKFAALNREELHQNLLQKIKQVSQALATTKFLFITLGTSLVYRHIATNSIVNNCHKLPQKLFTKEEVSIEDGVEILGKVITQLQQKYPDIQVIWTLSPVRHIKDGLIENNRSKARCALMIDQLLKKRGNHYFPSYELLMDDLRDYRYYADDLIHPNSQAIEYVWTQFMGHYFDGKTMALGQEVSQIRASLSHRPFNPASTSHKEFVSKLSVRINHIKGILPHLDF